MDAEAEHFQLKRASDQQGFLKPQGKGAIKSKPPSSTKLTQVRPLATKTQLPCHQHQNTKQVQEAFYSEPFVNTSVLQIGHTSHQ